MAGAFNAPVGGPTLPQQGIVVQSYDANVKPFNEDVVLDNSQIEHRR